MSMNFIDAAGVLADSAELPLRDLLAREAKSIVHATVAAYDALAPKPDAWPDGAEWYTIDAENQCYWHIDEPIYDGEWWSNTAEFSGFTEIPLGVDWRLLKWQRPEVAA